MPERKMVPQRRAPVRIPRLGGTPTVIVKPLHDNAARFVKHPVGGGFTNPAGTAWPFDQFTRRRLRDGDIEIVTPPEIPTPPALPPAE